VEETTEAESMSLNQWACMQRNAWEGANTPQ